MNTITNSASVTRTAKAGFSNRRNSCPNHPTGGRALKARRLHMFASVGGRRSGTARCGPASPGLCASIGGHGRGPYEQNTQQSPDLGFNFAAGAFIKELTGSAKQTLRFRQARYHLGGDGRAMLRTRHRRLPGTRYSGRRLTRPQQRRESRPFQQQATGRAADG